MPVVAHPELEEMAEKSPALEISRWGFADLPALLGAPRGCWSIRLAEQEEKDHGGVSKSRATGLQ